MNKYNEIIAEIEKTKAKNTIQMQSEHDLKKLCLEIQEFCQSLYVTIANDEHRKIYFDMTKKLSSF